MKKIICKKHLVLAGKDYYSGDEIPCDAITKGREEALKKYGNIEIFHVPDKPKADKAAKKQTAKKAESEVADEKTEPDDGKKDDE